jgi:hypothetical protein
MSYSWSYRRFEGDLRTTGPRSHGGAILRSKIALSSNSHANVQDVGDLAATKAELNRCTDGRDRLSDRAPGVAGPVIFGVPNQKRNFAAN